MNNVVKWTVSILLVLSFLSTPIAALSIDKEQDSANAERFLSVADAIIRWKKIDNGAAPNEDLINSNFLELAGTTPGDWFPVGLGRLGIADNFDGYLAVLKDQIEERYRQPGKLSGAKATEWHRISLAILAAGGDPTAFGYDDAGNSIDLIADGTYNRGKTTPLGRQGINGWIWGLIALDSMRYEVPADAYNTRDDIIVEILRQQLADGGFALSGEAADPDITAMALQALAPYYNSEVSYTYTQKVQDTQVAKTVRQVTEEALACLSKLQLETGDYKSWGTQNVESTCQVAVALCCLGIDPLSDARFIKNGNTLFDGILQYQMSDGGFVHSYTYDPDNPTSLPDQSNTMASEQTLYTMAALYRQSCGMRTLYDFRPEQGSALKARIAALMEEISTATEETDRAELEALLIRYYTIPDDERSYVYNYSHLSTLAHSLAINIETIAANTEIIDSPQDDEDGAAAVIFSAEDKRMADALPQPLTGEQYVLVTTLLEKLQLSEAFEGKDRYLEILQCAKEEIAVIQAEVDVINAEILDKLYPFDSISLKDKKTVDEIVRRYAALSEYDQAKIGRYEDVVKTKTKIDNALRAIIITALLAIIVIFAAVVLVRRIRKRRRRKVLEMEDLAAQYFDEDDDE